MAERAGELGPGLGAREDRGGAVLEVMCRVDKRFEPTLAMPTSTLTSSQLDAKRDDLQVDPEVEGLEPGRAGAARWLLPLAGLGVLLRRVGRVAGVVVPRDHLRAAEQCSKGGVGLQARLVERHLASERVLQVGRQRVGRLTARSSGRSGDEPLPILAQLGHLATQSRPAAHAEQRVRWRCNSAKADG